MQVISFTGSTGVGRHIGQVAAKQIKKVSLEVKFIMIFFLFCLGLLSDCFGFVDRWEAKTLQSFMTM